MTAVAKAPAAVGICCPKCGGRRWKTTDTDPLPRNRVRRYKACVRCRGRGVKSTIVTFEVLPRELAAAPRAGADVCTRGRAGPRRSYM